MVSWLLLSLCLLAVWVHTHSHTHIYKHSRIQNMHPPSHTDTGSVFDHTNIHVPHNSWRGSALTVAHCHSLVCERCCWRRSYTFCASVFLAILNSGGQWNKSLLHFLLCSLTFKMFIHCESCDFKLMIKPRRLLTFCVNGLQVSLSKVRAMSVWQTCTSFSLFNELIKRWRWKQFAMYAEDEEEWKEDKKAR